MEPICFALLFAMESIFSDNWNEDFDIIGNLPLEVAIIILRKLDPKSLVTAISVSSKWLKIIKFDRVLRNTVKEEMARQRREKYMRHMFLSKSVAGHASLLANARAITDASCPYGDPRNNKQSRRFEKSVKTVNPEGDRKAKKVKRDTRTWVSSVSTSSVRKFR